MRTSVFLTLSSASLLFACSSTDATKSGGGDAGPQSTSRLSRSARDELATLGVERYKGQAVETGEVPQGAMTRVTFDPASGPICLRGGEYAAFYLDRSSDKTMILLSGGGACWSSFCTATEVADATIVPTGPAIDTPDNYFRDWNVVFAPYCDGSVFSGDNEVTESNGTTRYHHGRQNLAAAFDLAVKHFGDSKQILLGGFSAGGYGTIPGMVGLRLLYPEADIFVMDDSGPGVQNPAQTTAIQERLDEWKFDEVIPPSCTACRQGEGQLSEMFSWMLENDPTIKVSVLSFFEDSVIGTIFNGFTGPEYKAILTAETGKVQSAYPDRFKRYMLPGTGHVLSGSWTTLTADGVKLSDWVTAMATGDDAVWKDIQAAGP